MALAYMPFSSTPGYLVPSTPGTLPQVPRVPYPEYPACVHLFLTLIRECCGERIRYATRRFVGLALVRFMAACLPRAETITVTVRVTPESNCSQVLCTLHLLPRQIYAEHYVLSRPAELPSDNDGRWKEALAVSQWR